MARKAKKLPSKDERIRRIIAGHKAHPERFSGTRTQEEATGIPTDVANVAKPNREGGPGTSARRRKKRLRSE